MKLPNNKVQKIVNVAAASKEAVVAMTEDRGILANLAHLAGDRKSVV